MCGIKSQRMQPTNPEHCEDKFLQEARVFHQTLSDLQDDARDVQPRPHAHAYL